MIPKKIHYVWVGNNEKSDFVNACIRNWKMVLPDYEFYEWNETNLDMKDIFSKSTFIKDCYDRKLWAFVSDYIRLKVLYEHGGIYLDTDITLEKDISPLINASFFIGKENEKYISAGVIGSTRGNGILRELINFYEREIYQVDFYTIPRVITHVFEKNENFDGLATIYPPEYFYPYYYTECFNESKLTENSYAIHWWGKSWGGDDHSFLKTKHLSGYRRLLVKLKCKLRSYADYIRVNIL
ncbi:glycosyltransferase [Vibrio campbellii]|uniref:Glycosyltransferase n=1 Tax=Vibrio campbellii TaxID=680 RepID=A0AAE9SKC0_9VIBR|nr:glycosyltransferase [Vibrio campbellii]UTZ26436.1 glycosyltransferase [Vibrio campbellii]